MFLRRDLSPHGRTMSPFEPDPPSPPRPTAGAASAPEPAGWFSRLSLRGRLNVWLLALLLIRAAAMLAVIYWAFVRTTIQHLDSHVEEELIEFGNIARGTDPVESWRQMVEREPRPDRKDFFSVRIRDDAGREVLASGVFEDAAWRTAEFPESAEPLNLSGPPTDPDRKRLYRRELTDAAGRRYQIELAADLTYLERYGQFFNWTIGVVFAASAVLGAGVAWWIVGYSLQPLTRLARRMERIRLSRLDERIPEPAARDEIAALVAAFNTMLGRLDRSVERLQQFTADAAHELRTPVAAAMTTVEVTLRAERTADEYRATLAGLMPVLEQLAALGRDMTTLAETDADRLRLHRAEADLNELVGEMVEFLQPLAEDRGLTLGFKPAPGGAVLSCDAVRLRQVFFNLIENAIKYTPAGGVAVEIAADRNDVQVRVADTGPGIPAEHLSKLFDRFYRLDRDRSRRTGGSGLGLAIARSLVHAHGGRITVDSQVGRGSTFTVRLPRGPSSGGLWSDER